MRQFTKILITIVFTGVFFISNLQAESPPLEIDNNGKVNVNSVLRLPPKSTPPANPTDGDIYFTSTRELLIYSNGKWIPILQSTYLGQETRVVEFTSSGTWTVPDTIKNITVLLVAGGGSGGDGGHWDSPKYDGKNGNGNGGSGGPTDATTGGGGGGGAGEQVNQNVTVTPGQNISITIGGSNQNSTFGSLVTARYAHGAKGGNAPNPSDYLIGGSGMCEFWSGGGAGGNGANGYGSAVNATKGGNSGAHGYHICLTTINAPGGSGGTGYGAGGGGGAGGGARGFGMHYANAGKGGKGAPGYCKITYTINKYQAPDGTIYYKQP